MSLHKEFPDKKIAVLNFASAVRPGGGVKNGSSAQEESLCRCSTLFPTIDRKWLWKSYYDKNRAAKNVIHTDACIYSPGVIICKTDESIPQRMKPEDFVTVDVISCAAPNLRQKTGNQHNPETGEPVLLDYQQQLEIHLKRAKHILHVAAFNNVDIIVLGAFGCGAFQNNPESVARAYRSAVASYNGYFDVIEFAVYCGGTDTKNYSSFSKMFSYSDIKRIGSSRPMDDSFFRGSNGIVVNDGFWETIKGKEPTAEETHAIREWKNKANVTALISMYQ